MTNAPHGEDYISDKDDAMELEEKSFEGLQAKFCSTGRRIFGTRPKFWRISSEKLRCVKNVLSLTNRSIPSKMRQLTEEETKVLFKKLADYTGRSLNHLVQPPESSNDSTKSERHVFRVQKGRVYYVRESIANLAVSVARDKLLSLGTNVGKFTKTGKFRLHITALDVIAPHARYKMWVKPNGEMPFLYGGNIVKAHVGRWSDDCPEHQGVVVFSMNDTPLVWHIRNVMRLVADVSQGFGVTARSTAESRRLEPTGITMFRQADVGEYLREEDTLFAT